MPLTSARTKALKHQLRCLYFDILVGNRARHFIPEKMWGEYVALVERMKLLTEDEDNEAFMALVTEVFETMPRDFLNPSPWYALQEEYDRDPELQEYIRRTQERVNAQIFY
jgi:hypothetical protein